MVYCIILLICALANPVVFLMAVLVCSTLCSPIVVYLWYLERKDKKEWVARMAKRAGWQAEAGTANKKAAADLWDSQTVGYDRRGG